jgi:2Fe-2S ferredoxin
MSDETIKVHFILEDGTKKTVDAPVGISLLDVAHNSQVPILGLCEGSLACSTCHVVVQEEWFQKLSSASEDLSLIHI